ncbi:MAG: hypothetical protein WDO73_23160 [Ignavibacteriota bacterium]
MRFASPEGRLYALDAGESANLPVTFSVDDRQRAVVKLIAMSGASRMALDVPLFPPAEPVKEFEIADGRSLSAFQHATEKATLRFGEGNGDGHAAPGEGRSLCCFPIAGRYARRRYSPAIRVSDNTLRGSDSWDAYDHSGASAKYSLPSIHFDCEAGPCGSHAGAHPDSERSGTRESNTIPWNFPVWAKKRSEMMRLGLLLIWLALAAQGKSPLKFEISWDKPMDGHVVLVIADNNRQEPRQQVSEGLSTQQMFRRGCGWRAQCDH